MRYKTALLVVAIANGLGAISVYALEPEIEEMTVTSIRDGMGQPAANVFSVSEDVLNEVKPVHPQELLHRVPGVGIQRGNGQESLMAIRSPVLTGPGACGNFLVMEEGIAVRGSGFCNVNEIFDTHFDQAGSLEVVRGTNTVFFGANALNGAINVLLPAVDKNQLSVEFGPDDYYRLETSNGYGDSQTQHGRLYLTAAHDGGYRDASGYDQYKMSWRHKENIGDWTVAPGLTATRLQQETAGYVVGTNVYRDKRLAKENPNPEAYRNSDSVRAWVKLSNNLTDTEQLQLTPYVRYTNMDFLQHFLPGTPLESNRHQSIGWQSSYRNQLTPELAVTIGIDGEISEGELKQSQQAPTFTRFGTTFINGDHYNYTVDAESLAAFTHWQWQPTDALLILGGVRAEYIRYDYSNELADGRVDEFGAPCSGCRYTRPEDRSDEFDRVSPRIEVQYEVSEQLTVHANWGDVYRPPQTSELYRLQGSQTVADLDMVSAESSEVGIKWSGEPVTVALTYYQIDTDNVIVTDSSRAKIDGIKTESEGSELNVDYSLTEALSLAAVANWADHQYRSQKSVFGGEMVPGNDVDTAPHFFGSAFARWQSEKGHRIEVEWQRVGRYHTDIENTREYPGHTLVHLRAVIAVVDRLDVSFRLNNVTDKRYAERADVSFGNDRYFPGTPRSAYLGMTYQF